MRTIKFIKTYVKYFLKANQQLRSTINDWATLAHPHCIGGVIISLLQDCGKMTHVPSGTKHNTYDQKISTAGIQSGGEWSMT